MHFCQSINFISKELKITAQEKKKSTQINSKKRTMHIMNF